MHTAIDEINNGIYRLSTYVDAMDFTLFIGRIFGLRLGNARRCDRV